MAGWLSVAEPGAAFHTLLTRIAHRAAKAAPCDCRDL
jgi:hypothetical protein